MSGEPHTDCHFTSILKERGDVACQRTVVISGEPGVGPSDCRHITPGGVADTPGVPALGTKGVIHRGVPTSVGAAVRLGQEPPGG